MDRRNFLKIGGTAAAVGTIAMAGPAVAAPRWGFAHGVASGDPLPDGVIIWTRVTPSPRATPGSGLGPPVRVTWEVATDPSFRRVVRSGTVTTTRELDHTVKVDVRGLAPATDYAYRFGFRNQSSPVGRTRTAPAPGADPTRLRFGVVSCSNYEGGFFTAYRYLAQRDDLDFVVHLGDYIYEYEPGRYGSPVVQGMGRLHVPPREIVSLADYRQRHAQYKTDPDLQALHARHPFVVTLDDHEVTNDTWAEGAENHQPATEGDFRERRRLAYQAYLEYMPLRAPVPDVDPLRIYRRLAFGGLADIHVLDLRQYRSEQVPTSDDDAIEDPARTMTGGAQLRFLLDGLAADDAPTWRLIGNSVMIAPIRLPALPSTTAAQVASMLDTVPAVTDPFNTDAWNGYAADRRAIIDLLAGRDIDNAVFLTGDIHSAWAIDLPTDPGRYNPLDPTGERLGGAPSVAVELVCTSVTSDNLNEITGTAPARTSIPVEEAFKATNPFVKLLNFDDHGYSVVEVTPEHLQMDYYAISLREDPNAAQVFQQAFRVPVGGNVVERAPGPMAAG